MTKEKLEQLRALRIEIELLEEELKNLPQTTDTVRGSMATFPYTEVTITVTGTDEATSAALKRKLRRKLRTLQENLLEMEEWIDSIEDSEMRIIIRMYYAQGMIQEEIADKLKYDRSTIAKKINNFFEK